jgi:hypothetical protein
MESELIEGGEENKIHMRKQIKLQQTINPHLMYVDEYRKHES